MADDPPKRKQNFTEYLKVAATQIEQRRKLWEALSIYIHSNGGWVTSLPTRKVCAFRFQESRHC